MEQELKNKNNNFTLRFMEQETLNKNNNLPSGFVTRFVEQENQIGNNTSTNNFSIKFTEPENKENKSYYQEFKSRHSLFIINFFKFLTDKKTLCSCSSLCLLIIILLVFFMPMMNTSEYTFPSYSYNNPDSLFSNMPYDL